LTGKLGVRLPRNFKYLSVGLREMEINISLRAASRRWRDSGQAEAAFDPAIGGTQGYAEIYPPLAGRRG